ncbi:hypothetical protein CTI12_AA395470 [Artemisia annua]|uniref:Uncharacterized protein n=1 Tax=Artemisia annua TaxID=35608 RepID=A0A2U1MDA1_ARTAN|nr:hypothetical protein CTI12_AA395470 [Artemisia annua]
MDMSKVNAASTTESVDSKFCENKKSEEVGFMDNAKVYMKSLVNASMDDHKACFKASWNRMVGRCKICSMEKWKHSDRGHSLRVRELADVLLINRYLYCGLHFLFSQE